MKPIPNGQWSSGYGSGGSKYALYGGYQGYRPPTQAVAANPAGQGAGGATQSRNTAQPSNPYTQAGNGPAGQSAGQGAYGVGGGYQAPNPQPGGNPVPGGFGGLFGNLFGGQQQQSAPAGSSGSVASITSAFGSPQLPYAGGADQQQTINRAVEQALQGPGITQMANSVRSANSGLSPSAGDMTAVNPTIAQRAGSAANAIAGIPYAQNLANSNALLQWQQGQGADVLGQAQNLAGINNAQQNYNLSQQLALMDAAYGNASNQAGLAGTLFNGLFGGGGLLGGLGNFAGGVLGGL